MITIKSEDLEVIQSLETLILHAEEKYPHFESPRGQQDIAKAKDAVRALWTKFTVSQISTCLSNNKTPNGSYEA